MPYAWSWNLKAPPQIITVVYVIVETVVFCLIQVMNHDDIDTFWGDWKHLGFPIASSVFEYLGAAGTTVAILIKVIVQEALIVVAGCGAIDESANAWYIVKGEPLQNFRECMNLEVVKSHVVQFQALSIGLGLYTWAPIKIKRSIRTGLAVRSLNVTTFRNLAWASSSIQYCDERWALRPDAPDGVLLALSVVRHGTNPSLERGRFFSFFYHWHLQLPGWPLSMSATTTTAKDTSRKILFNLSSKQMDNLTVYQPYLTT